MLFLFVLYFHGETLVKKSKIVLKTNLSFPKSRTSDGEILELQMENKN